MDKNIWFWWRHHDREVVVTIIGVKVTLFMLSVIAFPLLDDAFAGETVMEFIAQAWNRWDGLRYVSIAETGYQTVGDERNLIVFFPLFPLFIRILTGLTGSFVWSGLIVANVASVVGLYIFYCLARLELGKQTAWWSLVALMLFPTAYFFNALYTESLFLLLVVSSFYAARRDRWMWAGMLGGLAAFTRITGLLLFLALAAEFWLQHRRDRQRWLDVLWLLLIPGALLVYLLLNYKLFGEPFAFVEILKIRWYKSFAWPWDGLQWLWHRWGEFPYNRQDIIHGMMEWLAGGLIVVAAFLSFFKLRLSYAIYLSQVAWLILSTFFVVGTPRYLLGAFPLFFLMGMLGKHRSLALIWLTMSVGLLSLFMGHYVRGWWTF